MEEVRIRQVRPMVYLNQRYQEIKAYLERAWKAVV